MNKFDSFLITSIGRKQVTALTGLLLIGFLVGHLAGNLFLYAGPEAFNAYAKKLADLRPALLVVEIGLLGLFLMHILLTLQLTVENRKARGSRYAVDKAQGERTWSSKIMPFTGTILLAFVIWHLFDFTFSDHHGARALINGQDYGLYGVVVNSFKNPLHTALYILAMGSVGFHLLHGIQSLAQSFGWNHPKYTQMIKEISWLVAVTISLAYASIPFFVLFRL